MYTDECLKDLKVLLVEDEPDTAELFTFIFNSVGANVKLAVSAHEAIQSLKEFNPDIVISNITLPDGDGCSLIGQIKEIMKSKHKNIKGIAVTGLSGDEDKIRFLKAGFEQHLSKPIEPDNLIKVVANMADKDCN